MSRQSSYIWLNRAASDIQEVPLLLLELTNLCQTQPQLTNEVRLKVEVILQDERNRHVSFHHVRPNGIVAHEATYFTGGEMYVVIAMTSIASQGPDALTLQVLLTHDCISIYSIHNCCSNSSRIQFIEHMLELGRPPGQADDEGVVGWVSSPYLSRGSGCDEALRRRAKPHLVHVLRIKLRPAPEAMPSGSAHTHLFVKVCQLLISSISLTLHPIHVLHSVLKRLLMVLLVQVHSSRIKMCGFTTRCSLCMRSQSHSVSPLLPARGSRGRPTTKAKPSDTRTT
mmetsp:Transcript_7178/g.12766  ORF Transcript_7178/g.12766 Transcript_7178/m.12766 type:complete len:283 (+) Transcript_7178:54-902(+)